MVEGRLTVVIGAVQGGIKDLGFSQGWNKERQQYIVLTMLRLGATRMKKRECGD